jgi:tight adherence protein B
MDINSLLIIGLAMASTGGIFYAVAYPYLSGDARRQKRKDALKGQTTKRVFDRSLDPAKRRQQIIESIRETDAKTKKRRRSLDERLKQAGLEITKQQFYIGSAVGGVIVAGLLYLWGMQPLTVGVGALIGGLGIPRWLLGFLAKRRIRKFVNEFPNAVDVIIRGVKAGLPLGDCLRVIAAESSEPVRTEFRKIVESQAIGLSVGEAVQRLNESMPIAEANFFTIVISLQQKSGGNLSEALGNLSRVLRDRKKMRQKIKAMSSEAKASAGIIGCMPFAVAFLVYLTTPDYISLLWTQTTGQIVLVCCAFWMSIGIFVMRKLINFDF